MQMIIIVHNQQSANVNQLRIKGDINTKKNPKQENIRKSVSRAFGFDKRFF